MTRVDSQPETVKLTLVEKFIPSMKSKRLTLEKPRPVSRKRLEQVHKSGRKFQSVKSVTQESTSSKSPSESIARSTSEPAGVVKISKLNAHQN